MRNLVLIGWIVAILLLIVMTFAGAIIGITLGGYDDIKSGAQNDLFLVGSLFGFMLGWVLFNIIIAWLYR